MVVAPVPPPLSHSRALSSAQAKCVTVGGYFSHISQPSSSHYPAYLKTHHIVLFQIVKAILVKE